VGRLGSGVWVSASFQIFVLTAGENVLGGDGNCPGGEMFGENMSWGNVQRNVPHSRWERCKLLVHFKPK